MRIQWSSSAAQEMLGRLAQVDRSMEDCLRQSSAVRAAIAEANPDGANRALRAAEEHYGLLAKRLRAFEKALEAFQSAIRRADGLFEDAETELERLAERLDDARSAPNSRESGGERYIRWEPSAYAVMPDMRVSVMPMPDWFKAATTMAGAIEYVE